MLRQITIRHHFQSLKISHCDRAALMGYLDVKDPFVFSLCDGRSGQPTGRKMFRKESRSATQAATISGPFSSRRRGWFDSTANINIIETEWVILNLFASSITRENSMPAVFAGKHAKCPSLRELGLSKWPGVKYQRNVALSRRVLTRLFTRPSYVCHGSPRG